MTEALDAMQPFALTAAMVTSELAFGEQLAGTPYFALRRLGRGGMGDVYEVAEGSLAGPRYALKLLHARLGDRRELALRVQHEALVAARVDHPNVVRVFALGEAADGRPYLVMERLRGRDLRAVLARTGALPVARALDLAAQALDGLAAAHAVGVVHRDVKLENLFLGDDGTLKVLDFGIATLPHGEASRPRPFALVGTLLSMAPEQFVHADVDARADVYAAGLALYELVTGRGPFDELRGSPQALQFAHCERAPPAPSRLARRPIAADVEAAILRALAKAPGDRFPSARAMADTLRRLGARERRSRRQFAEAVQSAVSRAGTSRYPGRTEGRMMATRRFGIGLGILALVATACGGSSSPMIGGSPKAPAPESAGPSGPSAQGFGASEAQAGNAPPAPPGVAMDRADSAASMQPSSPASKSAPSATGGMVGRDAPRPEEKAARREEPADRPGLGTEWGETHLSKITTVPFVRADAANPFATASFFYNDEQGARDMANLNGFRRFAAGSVAVAGGVVSIGLRDEGGRFLSGFAASGKSYVIGESGRRYIIVVHNNTDNRLELVLSVDGLDVLDGKAASFNKRGYLVDPRGEVEIDGFRQSIDTVAAFRFGSVRGSYAAQKTGDTRNVGVIGVAVFNERGTNPFPGSFEDAQKRRDANPFPGQFATPP
jgi:serine/threonine protein kinase